MREILLIGISCAGILLLHQLLVSEQIYQEVWWSDIVLHFLGGVWVGMAYSLLARDTNIFMVIAIASTVGFFWEVIEFFINTPFFGVGEARVSDPIWLLDTCIDLVLDNVGAVAFWLLFSRFTKVHA